MRSPQDDKVEPTILLFLKGYQFSCNPPPTHPHTREMILLEGRKLEEVITLEQQEVCGSLQTAEPSLLSSGTQKYLEDLLVSIWVVQEAVQLPCHPI